jgi:4-diphosphocytidyl-2-C-methyl-D-erythritol kinase
MICFPNAKINLGLKVTERRPDGYHNLESLFYPVPLNDILEVLPGKHFAFESSGIPVDAEPDKNLVVRAYNLLKNIYGLPPVRIHLHKAIPFGAGLGGGSSDAAFMLRLLSRMFSLDLPADELRTYAARLGADCPFFIDNQPAFATGTGNVLTPVSLDLSSFHLLLVKPPFGVNTAQAYRAINPGKNITPFTDIIQQPADSWKDTLVNDFEKPVFEMFPEIARIKHLLYENGAVYASMSGSGSAVFGLFRHKPDIENNLFQTGYFTFLSEAKA